VIVVSGELSIVNVDVEDDEELPPVPVPVLELDEHAATPPQMTATAAMLARVLCLSSLPMLSSCCC
jgi:hypothetical protein